MRWAIILFLLTLAVSARAEETISLGDGLSATLEKAKLEVSEGGRVTWTFDLPEAGNSAEGKLEKHELAEGAIAVHARVDIGEGKVSEAVFVKKKGKKKLKVVWKEITGLKGDVGERSGSAVRFEDLTGDGFSEIITGDVSESVRLCGRDELPLLFRKVYDLSSGKFRPVLAKRPGLQDPVEVRGSFEPGSGPTEPLVKQIAPASASRIAGDRGEVFLLAPPGGIADGDPATAWIPVPDNGAGEFVTVDLLVKAYGLVRIGLRPIPDVARPEKYDRPKALILLTGKKTFRLVFPGDPLERPKDIVWFDLPEPVHTECMSLIVESSFAPSANRHMSVAELVALTEADAEGGLDMLAADLGESQKRRQAAMLLARAGARAVEPIRKVFADLDWQGQQRAVTVIAESAPAEGADLLVEAALGGDAEIVGPALRGIRAAGDAAVPPLAELMWKDSKSEYEKAVDLLASMGRKSALDALAAGAGQGDWGRRAFLRTRLAVAAGHSKDLAERLGRHIANTKETAQAEPLFDLLRAGAGNDGLADEISVVVNELWTSVNSFEDRWRLLDAMAALRCKASLEHLKEAVGDEDHLIRAAAVYALGECSSAEGERMMLIEGALKDRAPEVRMAALRAIGRVDIGDSAQKELGNLVKSDPWPEVRALVAVSARRLPVDQAVSIMKKAHSDSSSRVRAAALENSVSISSSEIDQMIEATLSDERELPWIKKTAAEAAEARCQSSALQALFKVLKKGAEPLADVKDISAAQAAARAIGAIGGEDAKELLNKAKRRSNPVTDRAIDAALVTLGQRCENKK